MKKYLNKFLLIGFKGIIMFLILGLVVEILGWVINTSFWDSNLGILFISLNFFKKLIIIWFLGLPPYFLNKRRKN
jgi:hypothetical protein